MQDNMIKGFAQNSQSMVDRPSDYIGLVKEALMENIIVSQALGEHDEEATIRPTRGQQKIGEQEMKESHSGLNSPN